MKGDPLYAPWSDDDYDRIGPLLSYLQAQRIKRLQQELRELRGDVSAGGPEHTYSTHPSVTAGQSPK